MIYLVHYVEIGVYTFDSVQLLMQIRRHWIWYWFMKNKISFQFNSILWTLNTINMLNFKISERIQIYVILAVCSSIYYFHTKSRINHIEIGRWKEAFWARCFWCIEKESDKAYIFNVSFLLAPSYDQHFSRGFIKNALDIFSVCWIGSRW